MSKVIKPKQLDKRIKYRVTIWEGNEEIANYPDVVADGIIPETKYRWFQLEDGSRVEIPAQGLEFSFSSERQQILDLQMKAQADAERTAKTT